MIGELWDDPRDERPEEDLDDEPEVFDEESELDDDLETMKGIERYVRADPGESCGALPRLGPRRAQNVICAVPETTLAS